MRRIALAMALSALPVVASAADLGGGGGGAACLPNVIRSEQMATWDFMAVPTSALSLRGFALAHVVRTALINDTTALPVVLSLPYPEDQRSAVATGLGRAACICERAGSTGYGAEIRRNAEALGGSFASAFSAAIEQCLHPVPFFGGSRGGGYGNVSPTKVGVPTP